MVPEILLQETEVLRELGYALDVVEEGNVMKLIIHHFHLPSGYSKQISDVLIQITKSYPNGKPDMFWVESDVILANGKVPKKADVVQTHVGRSWRRFSWHLSKWNPGRDNLLTFINFIENGLLKARES